MTSSSSILKRLTSHALSDPPADARHTCARILLLELSGALGHVSRDQLSRWADSLIAGESARTDPELGFMALHALDALAQVTTGIQWPDVVPPEDAVETIASLDWQNPTESAGFTRYLLLALIHRAEDHQDSAAAKEVRRVLKWLAEGLPDSYYLVPDRSGDAFQALAASSCLEPFFVYTFKPTHRVTIRVDAIFALLPRHQQLSGSNEVRCLALLDLLAGLKLSESVQRDDVDRALTLGRELLTFALADESDLIRAWTNCAVLGRIEQALSGGGVPPGSRRWPSPGFRWSAQTLTGNSRQPAATWLVPAGLEIPASPRPRVTVVIPCHNLGRYLPEAIESVCQQTFRDITIVAVDDGSSDTLTNAAIELLQARGIRVIAQENRGLAAARNRGASEATTEYVCCLDADDRLRPAYLERTVDVLDREPDVAFAGTGTQLFGESDLVLAGAEPRLPHMLAFNQATCVCVFRRTLWQSVGGFHTSLAVPGVEISDWDFWLSLLERGHRGVVLPELLFEYRIRTGSMSYEMYSTGRWPALITELVRRH